MGVAMSDAEVAHFLAESRTATVISINPNGMPLPTPVWFTNRGPEIFFSTMRKTMKAKNLVRDPRCVVQIEAGTIYAELRAAILTGMAEEASEADTTRFHAERDAKYGLSSQTRDKMPDATQRHYDNPRIVFRVIPSGLRTWDNRKLRMKG